MAFYSKEAIEKAKQVDLLSFLKQFEPEELVRISNNTYSTRTHDSLKISNGKWMWWSKGVGGKNAVDYLVTVKGMTFVEAVSLILNNESVINKTYTVPPKAEKKLILPKKAPDNNKIIEYLKSRGINQNVISFFIDKGYIYQSEQMDNIVFVGFDEKNNPRYAGMRGTEKTRYLGDCYGSDKTYPFRLVNKENTNIHLFEGAVDLLSYATLLFEQGSDFKSQNLVSLSGVYSPKSEVTDAKIPISLSRVLADNPQIKTVYLHLDNDTVGSRATGYLTKALEDKYKVIEHFVPKGKDVNDYLCYTKNLPYVKNKTQNYER